MPKQNNSFPEPINAQEADYLYWQVSGIANAGMGLFSAITIYKNEIIAIYTGKILMASEALLYIQKKQNAYFISLPNGNTLNANDDNCFAKYANDAEAFSNYAYKNNAQICFNESKQVCLVALQNIKAHQEIFCSYGKTYWQ